MTQPTQPAGPSGQPEQQPQAGKNNPYGTGTARKQNASWYLRAARKTQKGARKALLPAAIAIGITGAVAGGFEIGWYYQHYLYGEDSLEERVFYKKDEIKVIRKDGKLYYKRKLELEKVVDPKALSPKLMQGKGYTPI